MEEIIFQIGNKIKEIRKKRGLTQAELAEKINVDPKYISRLETGNSTPSIPTIAKISETLDVEMFNFFIVETDKKKNQLIELISSKLPKANIKELNAIFEILNIMVEKN